MTEVDAVDTDPTRLAARTLISRIRATVYNGDEPPPAARSWWRYALDDEQAVVAVLDFAHEAIERRARQLETQKKRGR